MVTTRLESALPQRSAAMWRAVARIALPSILYARDLQRIMTTARLPILTAFRRQPVC
jgi:hypothetical protein